MFFVFPALCLLVFSGYNNLRINHHRETSGSERGSNIYWSNFFHLLYFFFCLPHLLVVNCLLEHLSALTAVENNNNDRNSITSISLSVMTLFHPFPFLLKLYLTSSAVVRKQDYWYLSEMKVHF